MGLSCRPVHGGGRSPDSHYWATPGHRWTGTSPRCLRRGLVELAGHGATVGIVVLTGAPAWQPASAPEQQVGALPAGPLLDLLSALSYMVMSRAMFCPRMSWRLGWCCDLAVHGECHRAFDVAPARGVPVLGYLIGQAGCNSRFWAGSGLDGGLIGTLVL